MTWHNTSHHIASNDVTITWPDPATDIRTSKHFTSKHQTSPPWNGRRLVHRKEMVWASRWSVALRAFYREFLFLWLIVFFLWNFRPRLVRALLVYSPCVAWNCDNCHQHTARGCALSLSSNFSRFNWPIQYESQGTCRLVGMSLQHLCFSERVSNSNTLGVIPLAKIIQNEGSWLEFWKEGLTSWVLSTILYIQFWALNIVGLNRSAPF